jgi:lysophospholipase L1-like esterase
MMTGRGSWRPFLGKVTLAIAAPVVVLALFEGCSSLLFAGLTFVNWRQDTINEEKHSRYDADLGWVSLPNVDFPDLYGPGIGLHTNSRGFRGGVETSDSTPAGRRRLICSGDSFTLGFGVRDDEAWCAQLGKAWPELETVNMGQGGYGLDQVYLWYRRAGQSLQHDVQVLAYITNDVQRIPLRRFVGYGKPVLVVRDDSLVVTNVPAPERGTAWRAGARATAATRATRLNALVKRLTRSRDPRADTLARDSINIDVAAMIVRQLAETHRKRGSRLILVHLPVKQDYGTRFSDVLRSRMTAVAAKEGVLFVDLLGALGALPRDSVASLYLLRNDHLSAAGNRWVAEQLKPIIRDALQLPPAK